MDTRLPKEKIIRTYQRFSLPLPAQEPVGVRKLAFFYIGKQVGNIEKLTTFFDFGYMTASPEQAVYTLKRFLKKTEDVIIPDVIIAEGNIGMEKLNMLKRIIAEYTILADLPFIVEGSSLSPTAIDALKQHSFIDEILFLSEFAQPELTQKINFLKKVKQKWVHQPAACKVESSFPLFPDMRSFFKRTLDIAIAAPVLLVLGPVLLLIALSVRLESPGPVLQGHKKIGRGYRLFDLLKFRTSGKVGLLLRKTGLDELPQLFNVLLGDLSLVGQRPLSPHQAARLTTAESAVRFLSPAGLTGLWQFRKSEKEQLHVDECLGDERLLYDLWVTPQALVQKTNG